MLNGSQGNQEIDKIVKYEKGLERLLVKGKESMSFVNIKDILLVQRENNMTMIYKEHKSYIINMTQIVKIEPYGGWTYIVSFRDSINDTLWIEQL